MQKFLTIPNHGFAISLDSITSVSRTVPWNPVKDRKSGNYVNSDGDSLEVTITCGPQDEEITFNGAEAIRVNEMFFQVGVHVAGGTLPMWAVVEVTASQDHPSNAPCPGRMLSTLVPFVSNQGEPGGKLWAAMSFEAMSEYFRAGNFTFPQLLRVLGSHVRTKSGEWKRYFDILEPIAAEGGSHYEAYQED